MNRTDELADSLRLDTEEFGRIEVETVPLPQDALDTYATYTPSGKIFLLYRRDEDPAEQEIFHAAVIDDDGSGYRSVFSGPIPQHPRANGIRAMIFPDNQRVLLGDYVLECEPDIDSAVSTRLVDVRYPWDQEHDPRTTHHWSEIIVAPDGEHIAWTILRTTMGAAAALGRLHRAEDVYTIEDPKLISTIDQFVPDPDHDGCMIPQPSRGGEVKQFVRGGAAISAVGGVDGLLPDSVIQSLEGEGLVPVTRGPSYDETTIFSPDETLGLLMTARASTSTDPGILGLLPRPYLPQTLASIAWMVYAYTVTGVRDHRLGNVGPVLIDIERSRRDPAYRGVPLHDPNQHWVYVSPMSWHPDGRRGAWLETPRGSAQSRRVREIRIRRMHLLDVVPGPAVAPVPVPSEIPYAIDGDTARDALLHPAEEPRSVRVAGRHSGHLEIEREPADLTRGVAGSTTVRYVDYSDDGERTWTGMEKLVSSFTEDTTFEADVQLLGPEPGQMVLRATWAPLLGEDSARLRFEQAEDGLPASHGFAQFGGQRREISSLIP